MKEKILKKISASLKKTRKELFESFEHIFKVGATINEDMLEEVEEILYEADLGTHAADLIVSELRNKAGEIKRGEIDPYSVMKEATLNIINSNSSSDTISIGETRPYVIFVVGVNGVGKTTIIGKLALRFRKEGYSVLIAACDTFRAAAVEQLGIWAERSGSEFIKASIGADAASVAYDAMIRAQARSTDIVLVDTAGRLHTSRNLMGELCKIRNVINNVNKATPLEILLVLDATTGQNALNQADIFNRTLDVSGIALTKLDGTAKGGIVVSIIDRLGIPVKLVGTGEGIEDLRDFNAKDYTEALFAKDII